MPDKEGFFYSDELLNERDNTHGDWAQNSAMAQILKETVRNGDTYDRLSYGQKEAIDFICSKLARAVNGDPTEKDHWKDIAGYATLVVERG